MGTAVAAAYPSTQKGQQLLTMLDSILTENPPLLVYMTREIGKLPRGITILLPRATAVALVYRELALPVSSFAVPADLTVDESDLDHLNLYPLPAPLPRSKPVLSVGADAEVAA